MPADLMHLAAAQAMFPSIAIVHSIHGPRAAIGAVILELAFTTPSGPPPPHANGLVVATGRPASSRPPAQEPKQGPDTPRRLAPAAPAQVPTERRYRERGRYASAYELTQLIDGNASVYDLTHCGGPASAYDLTPPPDDHKPVRPERHDGARRTATLQPTRNSTPSP
jgi:hypothetical protein